MEFFFPGGFAHDYEYTTRALGMVHYGFWGDRCVPFKLNGRAVADHVSFAVHSLVLTCPLWPTPKGSKEMRFP